MEVGKFSVLKPFIFQGIEATVGNSKHWVAEMLKD